MREEFIDIMSNFIGVLDYILLPFFLIILFAVANAFQNSKYPPGHPWRPYFMPGFIAKIAGGFAISMVYQYYYGGGDTSNYFYHASVVNSALQESFDKWLNLLLHVPSWYDGDYQQYMYLMYWYDSPSEYMVVRIVSLLGMITFTTYLPIAILFSAISFTGTWALFRTFASKYPQYTKYIAWCTLFIPSTIMWGSGIFKDTICIGCLGWLTYCSFAMLINGKITIRNIAFLIISFYMIAVIKVYILLAFIPALMLWILFTYSHRIRSSGGRAFVKIAVIAGSVLGFLIFSQKFAASLGKFSLANVAQTSSTTRNYILSLSGDEGSGYNLGDFDPSIGGMLKKFLPAVNVTLFRPYLWEAKKAIVLINALEAAMFLWVTIKVLFGIGFKRVWRAIAEDPTIQFCLIFTLVFAFAVGISSYNFGTLSRYRIPCLPFYGIALVLIYYKYRPLESNILALRFKE